MRLKHIKGSEEKVSLSKVVIKNPEQYKGKWKSVFNNKIRFIWKLVWEKVLF